MSEKDISTQKYLAEEFARLLKNFKKDGAERKTPDNISKKLKDLDSLWTQFTRLHEHIETTITEGHPYRTEKLYDKTFEIYKAAVELISRYPHTDTRTAEDTLPLGSPATSTITFDIPSTIAITTSSTRPAFVPITTASNISNFSPATTLHGSELPFADISIQPTTATSWCFPHQQHSAHQEVNRVYNLPKLPPVKIPKFNGDYKEWKSFIDIFSNVIDRNPYISNVEKMQYLLYHLDGDAKRVINHLQLSDSNYVTALRLIKGRFNNNRKIITDYVNTIIDARKTEHRAQEDMIRLYDLIKQCLEALNMLNCKTDEWGPMIVCIAIKKLDTESLRLFEEGLSDPKEMPSVEELLKFLEKRHQVLDCIKSNNHHKSMLHTKKSFHTTINSSCPVCSKGHSIYHCGEFKQMNVDERHAFIRKMKLCSNCLAHSKTDNCKSHKSCVHCKKRHHSLLHRNFDMATVNTNSTAALAQIAKKTEASNIDKTTKSTVTCNLNNTQIPCVLLPTAVVRVKNAFGQIESFRALIDPGSQVSLITEEAVQILKLQKLRIKATILGVGEAESAKSSSKVNIKLQLRHQHNGYLCIEPLVLSKLNSHLPESHIGQIDISKYGNITLADPDFDKPGPIDLLLGADVYADIILEGIKKEQPAAQNTKLGWIIFGSIPNYTKETIKLSSFLSLAEIDEKLERFWEIEETIKPNQIDDTCDLHYQETHTRDQEGRYIVCLPFRSEIERLGDSRKKAMARFLQNEKKLNKNTTDIAEYNKFLAEYAELGHMSPARPFKGEVANVYYLPHHAVFKRDSTTTKLRVVFDGSSKSDSGLSLNDMLLTGPKLQQDLAQIFLRWRRYRYVYTADIEKMFRQIKINDKDKNYQRILWRQQGNEPIQEYILNTVTYGTAPASYLAVKTLKQLAEDEGYQFPVGKTVLTNDFYVDDMLTGADSKEEARMLQHQIIELLKRGKFNLRKWTSNSEDLLRDIPEDIRENGILEIKEDDSIKALGIHWNPRKDEFKFKLNWDNLDSKLTKRQLLSKISTIFDPLGWLAPVTFEAKLIMQSLWKTGTGWDEQVPFEITRAWENLEKELIELEKIRIPRWINHRANREFELHGFCDASEKGYAAVVYSRTIDSFGKIHTALLTSKTKVVPLKQKVTLPRLELCGALLLAQLLKATSDVLDASKTTAWCDSEIALAWIAKNPNNWSTFVANRVSEIQRLCPKDLWRHISSKDNPADVASRGITPSKILSHNTWWKGPTWLSHGPQAWPINKLNIITQEEAKKKIVSLNATVSVASTEILICSNYTKQIRIIAYCRRFIHNCKFPKKLHMGFLTSNELLEARNSIIKMVQLEAYSEEIDTLSKGRALKRSSKVLSLHPFLDSRGILCVGGRIQNSILPTETKHQILLPQKHHLTNLIIDSAHRQTLHGGTQLTLSYIRTQFWIINAKSIVQSRNQRCIRCIRHKQTSSQQLMGNLPAVRITPSPPFSHCGIDYAGPFITKMSKGRGTKTLKGYIALFVCMVTKAIHLELVSDLTTDAFLAAYKRFVARRGNCKQIFSDNATNFVGAKNQMNKDLQEAIKRSTKMAAEIIANDGTDWKFIPPASPHIGGLWEAGVKSVKRHLKCILGETLLTYEEFTTVLNQVEACVNSRPICQQSSDPTDFEPLTPGHFLIGRPLLAPPEPDFSDTNVHQRWKLVVKMQQDIWKRWSMEYLSQLQQRSKWVTKRENPSQGELVLIKSDILPPQKWSLGRITALHPGDDGIVRIVSVQDKDGIKKRPLVKICQLPLNVANNEEPCMIPLKTITRTLRLTTERSNEYSELKPIAVRSKSKRKLDQPRNTSRSKTPRIAPCTWASKLFQIILIMLYWVTTAFAKDYEILQPKPGLYVEDLGYAQIKRGNLRLQITFSMSEALEDQRLVNNAWTQIQTMCEETKILTHLTHCDLLFNHMSLKRNELLTSIDDVLEIFQSKSRHRRGLLGKFLTSVFGVNDEVYRDIETIHHNQQDLLQIANQQAILLNTRLNQSNSVIWDKLKQFDSRLSQVISSINEMKGWYSQADHNRISIEVISTYVSAQDYYSEIQAKYNKWLNVIHQHGHLLDFVSTRIVNEIIKNTTKSIGPNYLIAKTPQPRLDLIVENSTLLLHGYLNIIENNIYSLIHATPIPEKIDNNSFSIMDLKIFTYAVDYDQQTYFTLEDQAMKSCSSTSRDIHLCTPGIVHNIEDSPSCIIDAIYNRHSKTKCEMKQFHLTGTIWKALTMKNSWLYVTSEPKVVAVICKGARTDVLLNNTGIIRLHYDCVLKTREIILKTMLDQSVKVMSSHVVETIPSKTAIHFNQPPVILKTGTLIRQDEPILHNTINFDLPHLETFKRRVTTYSVISTATVLLSLAFVMLACYYKKEIKKIFTQCRKTKKNYHKTQDNADHSKISEDYNRVLASVAPQHVHM